MIVLKQGLGGHGLQPYDSEDGKYAEVEVSIGGRSVKNLLEYGEAALESLGISDAVSDLTEEEKKEFFQEHFGESYESLLKQKVHELNVKDTPYGKFYTDVNSLAQDMPKMFGEDFVKEYLKTPSRNGYLDQRNGYHSVPIACHLLMKMRYGDVKFNPIDEDEFNSRAKAAYQNQRPYNWEAYATSAVNAGAEIVIYRGMHYDYSSDQQRFENVFRGYVDSDENDPQISKSLLGGGCVDTVIYMSSQKSYSRGYANYHGHGMLVHCLWDSRGAHLLPESRKYSIMQKAQTAWNMSKAQIRANLQQIAGDDADKIYYEIRNLVNNDIGMVALLFGYDAIAGQEGNGNQLDILNPRRVYISNQFER